MTKKALMVALEVTLTILLITIIAATSPFLYRKWLRTYMSKRTVEINVYDNKDRLLGGGTGFYVKGPSGKTYIMTNRHICSAKEDSKLRIKTSSSNNSFKAKIIEISKESDLCLIESVGKTEGIEVADSLTIGDTINYTGHPRLQPLTMVSGEAVGYRMISVFSGIVKTQKEEDLCNINKDMVVEKVAVPTLSSFQLKLGIKDPNPMIVKVCIQNNKALFTTFQIYPGASGSPIVDAFGNLVSVVYAGPGEGGWGWGVTLNHIKKFLRGR